MLTWKVGGAHAQGVMLAHRLIGMSFDLKDIFNIPINIKKHNKIV